jgi:hypothetical protein
MVKPDNCYIPALFMITYFFASRGCFITPSFAACSSTWEFMA